MLKKILLENLIIQFKKVHDYYHVETDKCYMSIVPIIKARQKIGVDTYDIENIEEKVKGLYIKNIEYKDDEYLELELEKNITITIFLKEEFCVGPEAIIITPKDNGSTIVI